jgi:hypothetical protein
MTTLKGIKGDQIRYLDEDPVVQGVAGGTWASGGSLNTARSSISGAGTQTAAVAFGGDIANPPGTPAPYTVQALTESYNGTSWTEVNDLNKARMAFVGGVGTQTAALLSGGYLIPPSITPSPTIGIQVNVESWNGTSWTEVAEFSTSRYSFGTSVSSPNTDTMIAGGYPGNPPSNLTNAVETWNGTSWASGTAMTTPKGGFSGLGASSTAVLMAGPTTELWNGSSWTEVAEKNNARGSSASAGPSSSGLVYGGSPNNSSVFTEYWDGSTWTEVADLGTARGGFAGAGSTSASSAALAAGGSTAPGARISTTEEWTTQPSASLGLQEGMLWFNSTSQTLKGYGTAAGIPATSWASGGNLNTARDSLRGIGQNNSLAIALGGYDGTAVQVITEQYNGSAWTEVGDMNTGRSSGGSSGGAPYQDGIAFGGTPTVAAAETWNGTSWTEVSDLNTGRREMASMGISSSNALAASGQAATDNLTVVESWDGTSWTEVSEVNTGRSELPGAGGPNTASIIFGGNPNSALTEKWDGSAWTEVGDLNTGRMGTAGCGFQTAALCFSGQTAPSITSTVTEFFNGTSWTELNDLSQSRRFGGAAGLSANAMIAGGLNASSVDLTTTEEWTASAAVVTVTTS